MEIFNTFGWILLSLVCIGIYFGGKKTLLDIRPWLALAWGIFLILKF